MGRARASDGQGGGSAVEGRRELGSTGVEVTELGFGGAAIGNLYRELADERFTAFYENIAPGLAAYLNEAIHANAITRS